jgi:hypothetical protein
VHGIVIIEIGAVILGLGMLAALSTRWGISPIPFYLIAGLAFGHGGVLPLTTSTEFTRVGAEIGVILLLFTLGLEYTAPELVTTLRHNAPAGLVDLVLNAAPGVAVALLLDWGLVAAVAMGGITYVTSSGITAKVIGDLGWLANREVPVVLSLLVFEDLAMAMYLPILTALLAGAGLLAGAATLAIAAATITVILVVALRYGRFVDRFVSSPSHEVLLLKVLGLTVLVAGIAQQFWSGSRYRVRWPTPPTNCSPRCGTCSQRCSSCSSASRPTRRTYRRWPGSRPRWPPPGSSPNSSPAGGPPAGPASGGPGDCGRARRWYPGASSTSSSPGWPSPPRPSTPTWRRLPPPTC